MQQEQVQRIINKARQECGSHGMRLTDKRGKVLEVLLQSDAPLSAYDVIDEYKQKFTESLSAMSVYRMLDFLLQNNLVHKLETTNQYLACSHITCEHEHEIPQFLICDQCHTVKELGLRKSLIKELKTSIEKTGFALSGQQLELRGLCQQCQGGVKN